MHSHLYFITYTFEHFFFLLANLYIVNPQPIATFATHSLVLKLSHRNVTVFFYFGELYSFEMVGEMKNKCALDVVAILKSNFIHKMNVTKYTAAGKWFYGKYKIELIEKCAHRSMQRLMDIGSPPFPQKIKCVKQKTQWQQQRNVWLWIFVCIQQYKRKKEREKKWRPNGKDK